MKKKLIIICSIIAFAALSFLLYSFFNAGTPYMLTIGEVTDGGNRYVGKTVRISGYVVQDTIDWNSPDYTLIFILDDNGKRVTVFYKGEKQDPGAFISGISISVEGKYEGNGGFKANTLTMQ